MLEESLNNMYQIVIIDISSTHPFYIIPIGSIE
jgi:hypothetical protein